MLRLLTSPARRRSTRCLSTVPPTPITPPTPPHLKSFASHYLNLRKTQSLSSLTHLLKDHPPSPKTHPFLNYPDISPHLVAAVKTLGSPINADPANIPAAITLLDSLTAVLTPPLSDTSTQTLQHSYNTLLSTSSRCPLTPLSVTESIFASLPTELIQPNVTTFNVMANCYVRCGEFENAMDVFRRLPSFDSSSYNIGIAISTGLLDLPAAKSLLTARETNLPKDAGLYYAYAGYIRACSVVYSATQDRGGEGYAAVEGVEVGWGDVMGVVEGLTGPDPAEEAAWGNRGMVLGQAFRAMGRFGGYADLPRLVADVEKYECLGGKVRMQNSALERIVERTRFWERRFKSPLHSYPTVTGSSNTPPKVYVEGVEACGNACRMGELGVDQFVALAETLLTSYEKTVEGRKRKEGEEARVVGAMCEEASKIVKGFVAEEARKEECNGLAERVVGWLGRMDGRGVAANSSVLRGAVKCLGFCGLVDDVKLLIKVYGKEDKERLKRFVEENKKKIGRAYDKKQNRKMMRLKSVDSTVWNAGIISLCSTPNGSSTALQLLDLMRVVRESPDIYTYGSVFTCMTRDGNHGGAHSLLKKMVTDANKTIEYRVKFGDDFDEASAAVFPNYVCFEQALWAFQTEPNEQTRQNITLWALTETLHFCSDYFTENPDGLLPHLIASMRSLPSKGAGTLLLNFLEKSEEEGLLPASMEMGLDLPIMVMRACREENGVQDIMDVLSVVEKRKHKFLNFDMYRAASSALARAGGGTIELAAVAEMFEGLVAREEKELWRDGEAGVLDLHELNVPLSLGAVVAGLKRAEEEGLSKLTIILGSMRKEGGVNGNVRTLLERAGCQEGHEWFVKDERNQGRVDIDGKVGIKMVSEKVGTVVEEGRYKLVM